MTVTRDQLARLMGISPSRISQLVSAGMPARVAGTKGRRAEFDAVACLAWWRAQTIAAGADAGLRDEHLRWQTRKLTVEVREREGALVEVADVERRWAALVGAARERLLSLPATALQRQLIAPEHEDALIALVDEALGELAARGRAA